MCQSQSFYRLVVNFENQFLLKWSNTSGNCFEVQIEFRTYFGSQSYFQTLGQWYSRLDVFSFMEILHGRSTEKIMIL